LSDAMNNDMVEIEFEFTKKPANFTDRRKKGCEQFLYLTHQPLALSK
jgi:hypothetical protein